MVNYFYLCKVLLTKKKSILVIDLMKRILSYVTFLIALCVNISCNKIDIPEDIGGNDSTYVKNVSISLDILDTKISATGDNDICVMIYRNGVFYEKVLPESKSFSVDLMFNKNGDYKYDFYAYVNYGEYVGKDLPFEQEEKGLTSYGELLGITKDNVNSIVIEMKHNVNKITINSITFNSDDEFNIEDYFQNDRYLVIDLFLLNGSQYAGGEPYYTKLTETKCLSSSKHCTNYQTVYTNLGELHYYDNNDVMLVVKLSQRLMHGHQDAIGDIMYYGVKVEDEIVNSNQHKCLDLFISSKGKCSLEDAFGGEIKISYSNLLTPVFDNTYESIAVDNNSTLVCIYGTDKKFYTARAWKKTNKLSSEAVGVLVSDKGHSFLIHPTIEYEGVKFGMAYDLTTTYPDHVMASQAFNGQEMTLNILSYEETDLSAIRSCLNTVFANGQHGYLMSYGEGLMAQSLSLEINDCLEAIGGIEFCSKPSVDPNRTSEMGYWTSTIQDFNFGYLIYSSCTGLYEEHLVRPVCSLVDQIFYFRLEIEYSFIYGMTWNDWIKSYSGNNIFISDNKVFVKQDLDESYYPIKDVSADSFVLPVIYELNYNYKVF